VSELICVRCLQTRDNRELDRLLWCEECVEAAKKRSMKRGWVAGGVLFVLALLWVVLWVQPDPDLIPTVWIALLAAVLYLGARFAREVFFGWERIANRPAVEAAPPESGEAPGSAG
jgi:apolipoprotein N-acyltransferase